MQVRVPHDITIDTAKRVVRVLVSGIFDAEEGPSLASDARRAAAECGFNILYDIRAASPGKLENSDIFWWPRTVPALKDPTAPRVRVATVYTAPQRPIVDFWETAFRNVGLSARAFDDEHAAVVWLTGD